MKAFSIEYSRLFRKSLKYLVGFPLNSIETNKKAILGYE